MENCWNHLGWPWTVDILQKLTLVIWGTMLEYYFLFRGAMSENCWNHLVLFRTVDIYQ